MPQINNLGMSPHLPDQGHRQHAHGASGAGDGQQTDSLMHDALAALFEGRPESHADVPTFTHFYISLPSPTSANFYLLLRSPPLPAIEPPPTTVACIWGWCWLVLWHANTSPSACPRRAQRWHARPVQSLTGACV